MTGRLPTLTGAVKNGSPVELPSLALTAQRQSFPALAWAAASADAVPPASVQTVPLRLDCHWYDSVTGPPSGSLDSTPLT